MPQDPPTDGVDPDEQPTQPLPEQQPDGAAGAGAEPGADAPTVAYEPVPASTEPIAPYVPIADASANDLGGGAPPPPPPSGKSPVPWILGAAVFVLVVAIALALWRPWANAGFEPTPVPSPSESSTPSTPPTESPTEEPSSEPTQPEEPEPEPTQEPAPEPTLTPTETAPPDTPIPTDPTDPADPTDPTTLEE